MTPQDDLTYSCCLLLHSYSNRLEWEKATDKGQDEEFHAMFMKSFTSEKLKENEKLFERPEKYYKVRYEDRLDDLKFIDGEDRKQTNESGPFCFKIKAIPKFTVNENLVLMYEEVCRLF